MVMLFLQDEAIKLLKFSSTSNRTAPSSKHHQDKNGLKISGEVLSAPEKDLDATATESDSHLPTITYSVFVKDKQSAQESA